MEKAQEEKRLKEIEASNEKERQAAPEAAADVEEEDDDVNMDDFELPDEDTPEQEDIEEKEESVDEVPEGLKTLGYGAAASPPRVAYL